MAKRHSAEEILLSLSTTVTGIIIGQDSLTMVVSVRMDNRFNMILIQKIL
ncbi:hypothetical protein [Leptospira montravelensis]|nr:hypothetical protein [Leptospira montravelensis]